MSRHPDMDDIVEGFRGRHPEWADVPDAEIERLFEVHTAALDRSVRRLGRACLAALPRPLRSLFRGPTAHEPHTNSPDRP